MSDSHQKMIRFVRFDNSLVVDIACACGPRACPRRSVDCAGNAEEKSRHSQSQNVAKHYWDCR